MCIKTKAIWRQRPESNWDTRICNPLRNHSATLPVELIIYGLLLSVFSLISRLIKTLTSTLLIFCWNTNKLILSYTLKPLKINKNNIIMFFY